MKIAVTSQNFRTITPHAGKTLRFLVYEATEGGEPVEVDRLDLPKELSMHEFHADGPHPLDAISVSRSEAVIRLGSRALSKIAISADGMHRG